MPILSPSTPCKAATALFLLACQRPPAEDSASPAPGPVAVPWSADAPRYADALAPQRGRLPLRTIVHLHSAWSHDACDGAPLIDGVPDPSCLDDLRAGLCAAAVDVAFLTNHPDHAAWQPFEAQLHPRPGDTLIRDSAGAAVALRFSCAPARPSHSVTLLPGIEDELMPVALDRHSGGEDFAENHRLYNADNAEAMAAAAAAGGAVFIAHTEGRSPEWLDARFAEGATGLEIFNAHAMFDPRIRAEHLDLDPASWLLDIAPFTSPSGTAEPDLFFLAALQAQTPSLARWDARLAQGPAVGVAGSDAHQNVLPTLLRDGERGDSYRRALRWFSNLVWAVDDSPAAAEAALREGRVAVVFDLLGVPDGVDFSGESAGGARVEMGGAGPVDRLTVGCPRLAAGSARNLQDPEITVRVLKDGAPWADGCGVHAADGPGVYRVEVDIVPRHLADYLGEDPTPWLRPYPWVLTNAIRVTD
jgi:hypothetical protein